MYKKVWILLISSFFLACVAKVQTPIISDKSELLIGYVKTSASGCDVIIEVTENKKKISIYPTNLNPLFYKNGMRLRFYYTPVYTEKPKGCSADKVVILDEVTPLRE